MKIKTWLIGLAVAAGVMLAMVSCHDRQEQKQSLRDFDTIYTGTGPNTGTGLNLLQQAQLLNDMILFLNSIGLDDLTAQDVLNLRHLIDSLNIHLDVNDTATMLSPYALLSEIGAAANIAADSITYLANFFYLWNGADTVATYVPVADRDDATTLFPTIQSAAGDTSNYTVPDKIGDIYLDTSAGKVYVSVAAVRGGCVEGHNHEKVYIYNNLLERFGFGIELSHPSAS